MSLGNNVRLVVVVPVYGNWTDTADCIRALLAQTTSEFRVLIADDGSPTLPPAELTSLDRVQYLVGENLGFAGNCNRAAEAAISDGATHLLFLNNDTEFSSDFVEGWMRALAEYPGAVLSPVIYWVADRDRVWYSGGLMSVWIPFLRQRRKYSRVTRVDVICGCAFLVPAVEWRALGGFDRRYPMYFEDFDLAIRASQLSIPVLVMPDPQLAVWHRVSGSFRESGAWAREYRLTHAQLLFIRVHYQGLRRQICYALAAARLAAIFVLNLPNLPQPRALWRALVPGRAQ
ncbi:MAG: glycosyltransferase family 2 protein [Bryobacterales bacterium]|nr:glycosyltransferase family 2 protein [Bryobacterales bacterium]